MKILFIAPSAYLLGGVQDWLYMICLGLRARGYDVTVGVPNNEFHRLDRFNNHFYGINAVGFVNQSGTREGRIRAISKFLVQNPADIIVGVNIGDLYDACMDVLGTINESRIVLTLHAIEANYFLDIKRYGLLLDSVITTNRLSELMVQNLGALPRERILYAPYGVQLQERGHEDEESSVIRIAWVGRIENTQKRVSDLVGVLCELDKRNINYVLSVAGTGPYMEELGYDLQKWVRDQKVNFVGFLNKNELSSFYLKNDVLLITSQWETGPIVAWEAMVAGLVVVTSQYIGYCSEEALVHDETALVYPIGDHIAASKQIERLSDNLLRERIVEKGRSLALGRYSKEASINAWENAFQYVMSLESRARMPNQYKRRKMPSGRLEYFFGRSVSETLRSFIKIKGNVTDPGSEWPHSIQGVSDQTEILRYAEEIEKANK